MCAPIWGQRSPSRSAALWLAIYISDRVVQCLSAGTERSPHYYGLSVFSVNIPEVLPVHGVIEGGILIGRFYKILCPCLPLALHDEPRHKPHSFLADGPLPGTADTPTGRCPQYPRPCRPSVTQKPPSAGLQILGFRRSGHGRTARLLLTLRHRLDYRPGRDQLPGHEGGP